LATTGGKSSQKNIIAGTRSLSPTWSDEDWPKKKKKGRSFVYVGERGEMGQGSRGEKGALSGGRVDCKTKARKKPPLGWLKEDTIGGK